MTGHTCKLHLKKYKNIFAALLFRREIIKWRQRRFWLFNFYILIIWEGIGFIVLCEKWLSKFFNYVFIRVQFLESQPTNGKDDEWECRIQPRHAITLLLHCLFRQWRWSFLSRSCTCTEIHLIWWLLWIFYNNTSTCKLQLKKY